MRSWQTPRRTIALARPLPIVNHASVAPMKCLPSLSNMFLSAVILLLLLLAVAKC